MEPGGARSAAGGPRVGAVTRGAPGVARADDGGDGGAARPGAIGERGRRRLGGPLTPAPSPPHPGGRVRRLDATPRHGSWRRFWRLAARGGSRPLRRRPGVSLRLRVPVSAGTRWSHVESDRRPLLVRPRAGSRSRQRGRGRVIARARADGYVRARDGPGLRVGARSRGRYDLGSGGARRQRRFPGSARRPSAGGREGKRPGVPENRQVGMGGRRGSDGAWQRMVRSYPSPSMAPSSLPIRTIQRPGSRSPSSSRSAIVGAPLDEPDGSAYVYLLAALRVLGW